MMTSVFVAPVIKTVTVKTGALRAFHVFTADIDSWWPRSHHIGKVPMKKAIVEGRQGGRCYSEQVDGSECDWGQVLVWDPPQRLVLAWMINAEWQFEPDLTQCSEVEVSFTPLPDGTTRVDLEHRHLDRVAAGGGETMRAAVASPNGWTGVLQCFLERAERPD
jgi:uncharacterized protein YndB with AHSA1/START domain